MKTAKKDRKTKKEDVESEGKYRIRKNEPKNARKKEMSRTAKGETFFENNIITSIADMSCPGNPGKFNGRASPETRK
ncbi:MAG: hypothetical protein IJ719_02195 [Clostridia bacterium]|nr:hypothetical protein [Clostridia bacterium]